MTVEAKRNLDRELIVMATDEPPKGGKISHFFNGEIFDKSNISQEDIERAQRLNAYHKRRMGRIQSRYSGLLVSLKRLAEDKFIELRHGRIVIDTMGNIVSES